MSRKGLGQPFIRRSAIFGVIIKTRHTIWAVPIPTRIETI